MNVDGAFVATFTLDDGQSLTLTVKNTDGIEVYTAKTPDNPADKKRNTVMLRRKANNAEFSVSYNRK